MLHTSSHGGYQLEPRRVSTQLTENLLLFGKLSCGVLGVDQTTVYGNIEYPPTSLDQRWLHTGFLFNTGRQTGGPWRVISLHTILDRYLHHESSNRTGKDQVPNCTAVGFLSPGTGTRWWGRGAGIGVEHAIGRLYNKSVTDYILPQVQRALVFGESRFLIVN